MTESWLYIALGGFIAYLLVSKNNKAPAPRFLKVPIYAYALILIIQAALTVFSQLKITSVDDKMVYQIAAALQFLFMGITIVTLYRAFIKHREKYSKKRRTTHNAKLSVKKPMAIAAPTEAQIKADTTPELFPDTTPFIDTTPISQDDKKFLEAMSLK